MPIHCVALRFFKLFAFTVALALFFTGDSTPALEDQAPSSPPEKGGPSKSLSLDAWRALKKEADDLDGTPQGPGRIAKCQAFLKEHPDYPDLFSVLRILVDDTVQTAGYDPGRVAEQVERMAEVRKDDYGRFGLYLVEQYHLKYHLPPESAERLLASSRQGIERSRRLMEQETDPEIREQLDPDTAEFRLLLDEGRVLLDRGDAAGALKKLREAEAKGNRAGRFLRLLDLHRKESKTLPAGGFFLGRLNLALAEAHFRLGERAAATQRLVQARDFVEAGDEMAGEIEKLQEALAVPSRSGIEVRADPAPAGDFTLEDLEGKRVSLSDYRGRVVLVMLWTTW